MKRKLNFIFMLSLLLTLAACSNFGQVNQAPWYVDIENWTMHQRADFFMAVWQSEHADYKALNSMPTKSEATKKVLKAKYTILETSRQPIRAYARLVNAGGLPDQDTEDEIIGWIRQLQRAYLQ